MNADLFPRQLLQKIRDAAMKQALAPVPDLWKAAWLELAQAADKLDAMKARNEQDLKAK